MVINTKPKNKKHTVVLAYITAVKACIVEHDLNATEEEVKQQAINVQDSSQFTNPWVPSNMDSEEDVLDYKLYPLDGKSKEYFTNHEFTEAMLEIEQSKEPEKVRRKYRRKKKDV